jgi:phthiocerol/phenolphthiocerol synthesis type-I polyketide synthase E
LTGRILEAGEISAAYWRRHLREPVRFSDGIRLLADRGCEIFTELGPKPVLLTMGKRCFDRAPGLWVSTLDSSGEDEKAVLGAVSELYRHGVPVDWKALSGNFRLFNRKAILNLSPEEGRELLCFQIQSHVAKVLGLQPEHLDLAQPLNTMGLDSLMAIEMKNEIESNLKIKLSIATLIKAPNIQELASVLVEELAKPVSP